MANPRERILAALTYHLSNARHDFRTFCHAGDEEMIKAFEEAIAIVERELPEADDCDSIPFVDHQMLLDDAEDRIAELEAENAELLKDRERLEFLYTEGYRIGLSYPKGYHLENLWGRRESKTKDDFRDAIDEAMGVSNE